MDDERPATLNVRFKMFQSSVQSWETMFANAAKFASRLPTDRLVTISHSCDQNKGVVAVWYWATDDEFAEWGK